jgi:hypothetical protein
MASKSAQLYRRCILVGLLFQLLPACSPRLQYAPVTKKVIDVVLGGSSNHELLKSATNVSACRMHLNQESFHSTPVKIEYDQGPFLKLSAAQADSFRRILENPNSYEFLVAKACIPVYGARVRFAGELGTLDVDLCFDCNILTVSRDGTPVGGEDFDPAQRDLVAFCQEIFPGDGEIQKLKPR